LELTAAAHCWFVACGDVDSLGGPHSGTMPVPVTRPLPPALTAATSNKGTDATATKGSVNLLGGGLIDCTTLNAGTSIDVRSASDSVHVGAATDVSVRSASKRVR